MRGFPVGQCKAVRPGDIGKQARRSAATCVTCYCKGTLSAVPRPSCPFPIHDRLTAVSLPSLLEYAMSKLLSLPKTRQTLMLALLSLVPVLAQSTESPRSLTDCQGIGDSAARLACYDSLLAPARGEVPAAPAPTTATRSTIPAARPAPVVPQPVPEAAPAASAATAAATTARVVPAETQAEDRSFFKRLIPFGWGGDEEQQSKSAAIKADEPAPQLTGNQADHFGRQSAAEQMSREGVTELVDTIDKLSLYMENRWQITLSSGQIWRQQINKAYSLEEGEKVRIRPSGWGDSYRLYSDEIGGFIQVERVDK